MRKDHWRDVVGFEGLYTISRNGNVRDAEGNYLHAANMGGYRTVTLVDREGRRKAKLVHRLVAIAFLPNPEYKPRVNHKDRCKSNNHVDNLEWATHQEDVTHWRRTPQKIQCPKCSHVFLG